MQRKNGDGEEEMGYEMIVTIVNDHILEDNQYCKSFQLFKVLY